MQGAMIPAASSGKDRRNLHPELNGKAFLELSSRYSMDPGTARLQVSLDRLWLEGGYERRQYGEPEPDTPYDRRDDFVLFLQEQQAKMQLQPSLQQDKDRLPVRGHTSSRHLKALADYHAAVYELCKQIHAETRNHEDFVNKVIARQRAMQAWSEQDEDVWVAEQVANHRGKAQGLFLLEKQARKRCLAYVTIPLPSHLLLQLPSLQQHHQQLKQQRRAVTQPALARQEPQQQYSTEEEVDWWSQQRARKEPAWDELQHQVIQEWRQGKRHQQLQKMQRASWLTAIYRIPPLSWIWKGYLDKQKALP